MSNFFALLDRMKYIDRWALMRNSRKENVAEHSLQTAFVAHCLAVISNKFFGGTYSPERVALLAVYHESSEVITGDLPSPVKYHDEKILDAYKNLEKLAGDTLLSLLPPELADEYDWLIKPDVASPEYKLVKAADKLSALLKCTDEIKSGNSEFRKAKIAVEKDLRALKLPEVEYFIKTFNAAFELTLDDII